MNVDLDQSERRIRAALDELAQLASVDERRLVPRVSASRDGDRRVGSSTRWVVAASIVLLLVGVAVVLQRRGGGEISSIDSQPAPLEGDDRTGWIGLEPDASAAIPAAPIAGRSSAATVWTGAEMIVWGGAVPDAAATMGSHVFDDGAAFNPSTGAWRTLSAAPISARMWAAAVWTGTEMIVWGGFAAGVPLRDGAAYDPASDTWRTISEAPILGAGDPAAVWTGTEMIVTGQGDLGNGNVTTTAAYVPSTDTWRRLPDLDGRLVAPFYVAWTGEAVLLSLTSPAGVEAPAALFQLVPSDDDVWRDVQFQLPSIGLIATPGGSTDGAPLGAIALTPNTNHGWTALDPLGSTIADIPQRTDGPYPAGNVAALWTGSEVLWWPSASETMLFSGVGYDPANRIWRDFAVPAGFEAPREGASIVWADGLALVWGGAIALPDTAEARADGFAYRPPVPGTPTASSTTPSTVPPTLPATPPPTSTKSALSIDAVYDDFGFYGPCGNNSVDVNGTLYYQLLTEELAALDQSIYPRPDDQPAQAGLVRVGEPGPGDDVGTLVVFSDGMARFESESGIVEWLTTEAHSYGWVC